MKFDMNTIHTIFESSKEENLNKDKDQAINKMDSTLGDSDLMSIFDDICPITGSVYSAMKNAAADPKNLKIVVSKNGDGDNAKMFIEAVEFMTFCEASGMNVGEAAEEIIDTYKTDVPGLENSDIHVVFPSDSIGKNTLGCERYGEDTKNSWPMQLMRGCRRYGLKVASNIVKDTVNENTNYISESANRNSVIVNGKKVTIYIDSENTDEIQRDINTFVSNWDKIMEKIAKYFYDYYKKFYSDNDIIKEWNSFKDIVKYVNVRNISVEGYNIKSNNKHNSLFNINVYISKKISSKVSDDHVPACYIDIVDGKFNIDRLKIYVDG